jgi:hypothetical protein
MKSDCFSYPCGGRVRTGRATDSERELKSLKVSLKGFEPEYALRVEEMTLALRQPQPEVKQIPAFATSGAG